MKIVFVLTRSPEKPRSQETCGSPNGTRTDKRLVNHAPQLAGSSASPAFGFVNSAPRARVAISPAVSLRVGGIITGKRPSGTIFSLEDYEDDSGLSDFREGISITSAGPRRAPRTSTPMVNTWVLRPVVIRNFVTDRSPG